MTPIIHSLSLSNYLMLTAHIGARSSAEQDKINKLYSADIIKTWLELSISSASHSRIEKAILRMKVRETQTKWETERYGGK